MNYQDKVDIALETIEVFINHILYVRGVYPTQIFKKRRVYNTPIYVSVYPPLNAYICNILRTARELLRNKDLEQLDLVIYRNEYQTLERYTCEIKSYTQANTGDDHYLLQFEEELRKSLYKLADRLKILEKVPNDAQFKLVLHTTQTAFVRLSNDTNYQEFPWLHASQRDKPETGEISLLPLINVETVGLKWQAEV